MIRIPYEHVEMIGYPIGECIQQAIEHTTKIAAAFKSIPNFTNKNLNIFCRGSSGAMLAALFVSALQWPNIIQIHHVKKEGEKSHVSNDFNILTESVNILIDDLIASGSTVQSILKYMPNNKCDILILCENNKDFFINLKLGFLPEWFIHRVYEIL